MIILDSKIKTEHEYIQLKKGIQMYLVNKTEYKYEYIWFKIISFLNIFGPNYLNIFKYRIIHSPLFWGHF